MSVTGDDTSQNDTVSQVTSSKPTYDATSCQPTPNNVTIVTSDNGQLTQLSLSSLSPGSLSSLGQHHQGTLASVFPPKNLPYILPFSSSSPSLPVCDSESQAETDTKPLTPRSNASDISVIDSHCRGSGDQTHQRSNVAKQQGEGRMNRNGFERNGMTGSSTTTSENLTWLASASQAQAAQTAHQRPPGGAMLPPTTIAAAGHDPHFQLPVAGGASAGLEALYRSGLTVTDPSSRLFVSGQYSSVYTTTGTTLSPYSQSLYSSHGSQPLSPYAAAYMYQWPPAYSPGTGALLPGQYPHIESFSAVLQNLGSQHAQHSHLPRLPYVRPHIPHAPYPGTGSLTTTTDSLRVPAIVHRSSIRMGAPAAMEPPAPRKSPKREQKGSFRSDVPVARHSPHDRKSPAMRRYSPLPATQYRHAHHSPPVAMRDTVYRDADARHTEPCSTRKQRILTQSPQVGSDLSVAMYTHAGSSGGGSMAPPLLQRSGRGDTVTMATSVGHPPPLLPSHSSSTVLPQSAQSSPHLPPLPPLHPAQTSLPYPADPHYPAHFMKGSIIQLANGELKRVEELRTDDFISSADVSADLKIDSSTVVRIEENAQRGTAILGFSVGTQRIQVTVEATQEHPFFVFGQGWSSCSPQRTMQYYSLQCHQLQVGDICISLTHKDTVTQPSTTSAIHPQSGDATISVVAPQSGEWSQRSSAAGVMTPRFAAVRQTRSAGLETSGHAPTRKRCCSAPGDIKSDSGATHGDGRTIGGSTVGRRVLTPGADESAMKRSRTKTPPPT